MRLGMTLLGLLACAPTGTRPSDMSASQHEAMAAKEEAEAKEHAEALDLRRTRESCMAQAQTGGPFADPCWRSFSAPEERQLLELDRHRVLAAAHRRAARQLRSTEDKACRGLAPHDRDTSPFAHTADILSVTTLPPGVPDAALPRGASGGARVAFRPVPGLTLEGLQHLVACHLARNAELGFDMPEMSYCPLAIKGVSATAARAGDVLVVDLQSKEPDVIREIRRRAEALGRAHAHPPTDRRSP